MDVICTACIRYGALYAHMVNRDTGSAMNIAFHKIYERGILRLLDARDQRDYQ